MKASLSFSEDYLKRVEILEQRIQEIVQVQNNELQYQPTLGQPSNRTNDNSNQMEYIERDTVGRNLQRDRAEFLSQPRDERFLSINNTLLINKQAKFYLQQI